jgi:hypothetical protein
MRLALMLFLSLPAFGEPRLLQNSADLARIAKLAWAHDLIASLAKAADEWPEPHVREFGLAEWAVPKEGAGWAHTYVCPEHGVRLTRKQGRNLCPVDGKDFHGWPIDNVVYMQRNDDNARAARDLGLAFRITGKAEYAEKARRIFSAYAELYPGLPIHDNNNRRDTKTGARVMSQTLDEAGWLLSLAFGYDLVRDAMPAAERARFEENVLRNAAAVIRRNDAGKSNWQSWHNAALLASGLLLDDRQLVQPALDGPGGFKFQMRESVLADGSWYEGAWSYHFYALEPLLLTREMAVRAGIELPEAAVLERMLDAPLACVFPDGTLPDFNDSGYTRLAGEARFYDIGYRIFHERRYLAVAAAAPRGIESMLWGAEPLPADARPEPFESALLPDAGIAILRVPGSDHTVAVKFGPHGGGHGHFDKLSFISYADGARQAADPGTQAYGAKSHDTWDKMTIAHNTLSVDGKVQAQATGKLLDWTPTPSGTAIRLSAGPIYPGVDVERTLIHTAEYTLDVLDARATDGASHQFDWMYHNFGTVSTELPLEPYARLPQANGYQHLTQTRAAATADAWQVTFAQEKLRMRVRMLAAPDTMVVVGEGLGPDLLVPVPFVMARRRGTTARFVAFYEAGPIAAARITETAPGKYTIVTRNATDQLDVSGATPALVRGRTVVLR